MIHARRLQLLREIRDGQDRLTGGKSVAEHMRAMAKLAEWQCLAERMDITLEASYTVTVNGGELQFATATLTPSGKTVLDGSEQSGRVSNDRGVIKRARAGARARGAA